MYFSLQNNDVLNYNTDKRKTYFEKQIVSKLFFTNQKQTFVDTVIINLNANSEEFCKFEDLTSWNMAGFPGANMEESLASMLHTISGHTEFTRKSYPRIHSADLEYISSTQSIDYILHR